MTRASTARRIQFFGTYDEGRHPRVAVLREGLREVATVEETNIPADIDTAMRVEALQSPRRLIGLVPRLVRAWAQLILRARSGARPDVVVVGHLGHLDILLARVLFPRARLCLDYLISLADTARDRHLGQSGLLPRVLHALDWVATRVADDVMVDTTESIATIPTSQRHKAVVVPVGASQGWFDAAHPARAATEPLRVVFFGLFTPLQGAPVIGEALRLLHERGVVVEATLIGKGQDREATRTSLGELSVRWLDWVDSDDLSALVAGHDVCLGIFGTGPKAQRVVPNKAYQGAAAGCAIVTSDTPPQRRMLSDACLFVPAGDPAALADSLAALTDREVLQARTRTIREHARTHFAPEAVAAHLMAHLASAERATTGPTIGRHHRES